MGRPSRTQITRVPGRGRTSAQTLMTTLPRAWPSITSRIAAGTSPSEYVRSMAGIASAVDLVACLEFGHVPADGSTVPAKLRPGLAALGRRNPKPMTRMG